MNGYRSRRGPDKQPRRRYYRDAADPDRPTWALRKLLREFASERRIELELNRLDRFLAKIETMHLDCTGPHGPTDVRDYLTLDNEAG